MHARVLFLPTLLLASACVDSDSSSTPPTPPAAADFSADSARDWFDQLTLAIDTENLNPPEASRRLGYAGVTLFEAVVGGIAGGHSLAGQLNELGALPAPPAGDIHWPSAANAALADVLASLFATATPGTLQGFADLETAQAAAFAADAEADVLARSVTHGEAIAAAILAWVAGDDYALWNDCAYTVPTGDGLWEPTPPAFVANPLEPCWGKLRPFVLISGAECAPLPHPNYSRTPGSPFALEAQEVYDTGNSLTLEQQEIATFWADGAGTLTPPGHWVSITGIVLGDRAETLDVAAEAYAKVGIAVADAFIGCWEIKFVYNLERPISYIRDPAGPINDAAWTSFIGTPPFPEFSSGHSTQSGAAATVLTDLFGTVAFTDTTHAALPARAFASFEEAADEAAISRLYGGIHFRAAIQRGLEQGECIGRTLLDDVQFRD